MTTINLVMAREPLPAGSSVYLAGPTPYFPGRSWRHDAYDCLADQWTGEEPVNVLSPEPRDGNRAEHYEDQADWTTNARATASVILFWVPRDVLTLPGFTTNVEFGLDATTGRAVLGCPPDCPNPKRNRYLIYIARQHGVPVHETLPDTVTAALALISETPGAAA